MAFNLGNLAGLGGLTQSSALLARQQQEAERLKMEQTLQAIAMQQQQQQMQGAGLSAKAIRGYDPGQIQQPQMAPLSGGGPDQLMGTGGGMPQPQRLGGGMASGLPAPGAVKGSWFGNSPGWQDPSDSGLQASGVPVAGHPGIALPSRKTLGQQFDITTPDGRTFTAPQTDIGPAGWTGRGVDVDSELGKQMGYTPQTFPTDKQFIVKAHHQLDTDVGQKGAAMVQQGAPVPAIQASTGLAKEAGREINPQQWGMAGLHQMMAAIDKADPDAPDAVKMIALGQLSKLIAPEERLQVQMYMKEHQQELSLALKDMQIAQSQAGLQERTRHDVAMEGIAGQRLSDSEGGEKYAQSKMIEYMDKDGNTQQTLVRERKGQAGFIDSITGQPWKPPEGATGIKEVTAGTAGGGRAGAQIGRQITAGAEVMVDLQNVRDMPVGTTTGLFGSVTPGTSLSGALKGDLARTLTSEDEINMKQAMSGIGRELSTLMSPVYGGNWASEQLEPLIPKTGYTINNALYGIARIKQSAVNAIDSLQVSPIVGSEQKKYAKSLKQQIEDAIPWDVKDVVAFQSGANPKQTFGEYSTKKGVAGAAARKSSGGSSAPAPTPGTKEGDYIFKGGDPADPKNWTAAPEGAAETR